MKYYLIDYENVTMVRFDDLIGIKKKDGVIIFYSESCPKMSLDMMFYITQMKLKYKLFKTAVGRPNSLDFQLSSYLGYLIHKSDKKKDKFFIVSNDKGYDCLKEFWGEKGYRVERIGIAREISASAKPKTLNNRQKFTSARPVPTITLAPQKPSEPNNETATKPEVVVQNKVTYAEISKYLTNRECPSQIMNIFNSYATKQEIYREISRVIKDPKLSGKVYHKLDLLYDKYNKQ